MTEENIFTNITAVCKAHTHTHTLIFHITKHYLEDRNSIKYLQSHWALISTVLNLLLVKESSDEDENYRHSCYKQSYLV